MSVFRNIQYGVINLIKWFPVIWKNRDWDNHFIYIILRHKLNLMEKLFREDGHHVSHKKDAKSIKKCVLILDRLIDDVHNDIAFKKHYEKWGEPNVGIDKKGFVKIEYKNVHNEKDEKNELKDFHRCYEQEEMLVKQDIELLFGDMRKYIRSWWD